MAAAGVGTIFWCPCSDCAPAPAISHTITFARYAASMIVCTVYRQTRAEKRIEKQKGPPTQPPAQVPPPPPVSRNRQCSTAEPGVGSCA